MRCIRYLPEPDPGAGCFSAAAAVPPAWRVKGTGSAGAVRGWLYGPSYRKFADQLRGFLPAPGRWGVCLSAGGGGGRCPHGGHRGECGGPICFLPQHGSCICTSCWGCPHPGSPIVRCCWLRMDGGGPSGRGTRAWKVCGPGIPARRSSENWPTPIEASAHSGTVPPRAWCRISVGKRCPKQDICLPAGLF